MVTHRNLVIRMASLRGSLYSLDEQSPPAFIVHPDASVCDVYLLRPQTEKRVSIGIPGEICTAGPQAAGRYWAQHGLTAAQFPADRFVDGA